MRPFIWFLILEIALVGLIVALAFADEGRVYHRVLIKDVAETIHTHICTTGLVAVVRKEKDGDVHIRLEDGNGSGAYLIAEIIPTLLPKMKATIRTPKVSDWVEVCGITRIDRKHKTREYPRGWPEIHPVERLR